MNDGDETPRCKFVSRCPMFPAISSNAVLKVYQQRYCHGEFQRCVRYQHASTGTMPPPNLLPDGDLLD